MGIKDFLRPKEAYLITLQVIAISTMIWALFQGFPLELWGLGLLGYSAIFCLGVTVTFHRLMAHRSYGVWKPLEYLFALFANLGCTGSSVGWVFVHRAHHAFTDKEGDPHSPVVYGPIGAMIGQYGHKFEDFNGKWLVRDVVNDPVHRTYHDYHHLIVTAFPLLLLAIGFKLFVFCWAVPVALNTIVSRGSNWIDHEPRFGNKPHGGDDAAHNVWWWSIPSMGEGWHNNHHTDPANFRYGTKWWQWDPGKYVINTLMFLGLAWTVRNGDDWRKVERVG